MPKKTNKQSKITKKNIFIALLLLVGLVLISLQLCFNKFIYDRYAENGSLKITILIDNALEGLENIKHQPKVDSNNNLLIPESRLKLPPETPEVRQLLYIHEANEVGEDGSGYTWNIEENIQITTKQLSTTSRQKLYSSNSVEDLFNQVPEAQACNRGFKLLFSEINQDMQSDLILSGTKKLSDGRTLFVYHEPKCKTASEIIDSLESYLLQAQSY